MSNVINMVNQFNEIFKADQVSSKVQMPTVEEMRDGFGAFMMEEVQELAIAHAENNVVEFFDALCDIIYITAQQAELYGFPMAEGLLAVHAANMSKLDDEGNPIIDPLNGKVKKSNNFVKPEVKLEALLDAKGYVNDEKPVIKEFDEQMEDAQEAGYVRPATDEETS